MLEKDSKTLSRDGVSHCSSRSESRRVKVRRSRTAIERLLVGIGCFVRVVSWVTWCIRARKLDTSTPNRLVSEKAEREYVIRAVWWPEGYRPRFNACVICVFPQSQWPCLLARDPLPLARYSHYTRWLVAKNSKQSLLTRTSKHG